MEIYKYIDRYIKKSKADYILIYNTYKYMKNMSMPIPSYIAKALYFERALRHELFRWVANKFYYEPLLRTRCASVGRNVQCDGDIPLIIGSGEIIIGDDVFIGNRGAWFVTSNVHEKPLLKIGNNTSINYRTVISVEKEVIIGNNCLIAEETKIFDNNSHGIDYRHRKLTENDIGSVIIEDNVWIGMNSIILKNVRIGQGAVVSAGSVVTKKVEPMTIVGGNPAKFIKKI